MKRRAYWAGAVAASAVIAIAAGAAHASLTPVKPLDPLRYTGRWYEIARVPNKLEADCVSAVSDWSRQPDGSFDVVQTCRTGAAHGPAKIWRGVAHVVDALNARFRIGFFGGFVHMDYQVLDRDDAYSWCILTAANPKYLWIMSRRPHLDPSQKAALIERARSLGYNVDGLIYDSHAPTS
jgi:apolipoprotein D and lipocalin family protein